MMSTVGLELTNFLNPDLTWKKVSKGNRSATRRTRKPPGRDRTAGVEIHVKRPTREEDSTVSESEKLGVAVLGRRFSDKIEYVPIKKRKFNLRSPSPPPCMPSPRIEVVQHASSNGFSQKSDGNTLLRTTGASTEAIVSPVVNGCIPEAVNDSIGYGEDFSGIEMLAAAACSDSFDVDQAEEHTEMEGCLHKENESVLVEETVPPLETVNISLKDPMVRERIEESPFQDATATSAQKSPVDEVEKMVGRSASSRDDRLHWDLNVVIDAWEKPCDMENVGSQTNSAEVSSVVGSGKLHIVEGCEMERETETVKHDDMVRVDSSEVHGETHIPLDSRGLFYGSNRNDSQLETCTGLDCSQDECSADSKASARVISTDPCNNVPCEDNGASKTLRPSYLVEKTDGCPFCAQEEKTLSTQNVEVEKCDVTSPQVSALDRITCEIDNTSLDEKAEESGRASDCASQGMLLMENSQVAGPVSLGMEPASKPEEVDTSNPLPTYEEISTSSAFVEEVYPVESVVAVGVANEALEMKDSKIDSPVDGGSVFATHEKCSGNIPTNSVDEVKTEDPAKDVYESEVAQESKFHIVGMENPGELHTGYDSQFEDGELRESDIHGWEDLEAVSMEIEQVDYESDCDGERLYPLDVEDIEDKRKIDGGSICGSGVMDEKIEQCAVEDAFGDHHLTRSKMRTSESKDGSKIKNYTADSEDGPDSKDFNSRMFGPRISKRELLPRFQGSLSSDIVQRNRPDVFDDFCPQSGRSVASNKFMGRDRSVTDTRCRSPGGGRIVNTRQSPTYPYGSGRPRNVIENRGFVMSSDRMSEAAAAEEFDNRVRRQYLSSSSNSVYRPLNRRYVSYRDDIYGHQAGSAFVREDISPDRSRFRKYPQGVNRGIREDYHRPMPCYASGYPYHMRHRLSRRERSISPPERLHYAQPYKKSLSRSRSRSPSAWLSSRERNEGSRRRSRSPIFRSGRIERVRLPYQKQFAAEYDEGFMSPPRNRFSPHRSSRYDDRVSTIDNFRVRKSPLRMFRQSQRFDSVRPIRPMGQPRRYADMGGGAGRRYKYEGASDDGRKQGNRYEMMHRVRRYDTDGAMRRLRYNAEDAMVPE